MNFVWSQAVVIAIFSCIAGVIGQSKVTTSDDGQEGTISFSTPDLSDEESHSPWMPDQLKCDACKIVALQYFNGFEKFNENHKYLKYDIPESEILDIVDETCLNGKTWERIIKMSLQYLNTPKYFTADLLFYGTKTVNKVERLTGPGAEASDIPGVTAGGGRWPQSYGVKEVNKVKRLSGPGTEAADVPGVMAGGGKWPSRLMDMCEQYMGNIGEMEIYKAYRKNRKSLADFQKFLCHGKGIRGDCLPQEKTKKKKEEL